MKHIELDVEKLPELAPCSACRAIEGVTVSMEMTASYINSGWFIWCGCGCASDAHRHLIDAVNQWNAMQERLSGIYPNIAGRLAS